MERIARLKDRLIDEAERLSESNARPQDMAMVVDMIKDLAEAEKECMEALYYEEIVDAMEGGEERYGYDDSGMNAANRGTTRSTVYNPPAGHNGRMGYRDSKGRYSTRANRADRGRSGYSEESIENVRIMMEDADPARREQLKRDLENMLHEM